MNNLQIRLEIMEKTVQKWLASGEKLFLKKSDAVAKKDEEIAKYKKEIADLKAQLKGKPKPQPEEPKAPEEPQTPDNPGTPDPEPQPEEPAEPEPEPDPVPEPEKPQPEPIKPPVNGGIRPMITNPERVFKNLGLATQGDRLMQRAVHETLQKANDALQEPIQVLTTKPYKFFNVDARYFQSVGPYWHKIDGRWVMKDGKGNGLSEKIGDTAKLHRLGSILPALAKGYVASTNKTQREKYAQRLIEHCQAFFLDSQTGMLPSMKYANTEGEKPDAIYAPVEFERLVNVADALVLVESSEAYTPAFRQGIQQWFGNMAHYLANSEQGKQAEKKLVGNIATIYELERLCFAVLGGDTGYAAKRWPHLQDLLLEELDGNNHFWRELSRAKPNMYSNKSIQAWFKIFRILAMQGVDCWNAERNGKSLLKATLLLNQYMLGKKVMKAGEKIQHSYFRDVARTAQLVWGEKPGVADALEQFLRQYDADFRKGAAEMVDMPYYRYKW